MRNLLQIVILSLLLSVVAFAQTAPPAGTPPTPIFSDTTVTMNLSQITLPGHHSTLAGAETDILWSPTTNNAFGQSTLVSGSGTFIGGRYNRVIPQFNKWLNNLSANLNGYQFQLYLTASAGVVKAPTPVSNTFWGERAGIGLQYGINNTWAVGAEVQWNNFPGIAHNTPSLVLGPSLHF